MICVCALVDVVVCNLVVVGFGELRGAAFDLVI